MVDPANTVHDRPVRPGQYRQLLRHGWGLTTVRTHLRGWQVLRESIGQEWVPIDPARPWLLRTRPTGAERWLRGSRRSAVRHGFGASFLDEEPIEWQARYGDYGAARPRPRPGCWQFPSTQFLAALPRDPEALLNRLTSDSPDRPDSPDRRGQAGPWTYAVDALKTGRVPADLRAALYRALALLPAVRTVEDVTNLDGAPAIALVLDRDPLREEIHLDPRDGQYIGSRTTVIARNRLFPFRPGTVTGPPRCGSNWSQKWVRTPNRARSAAMSARSRSVGW